MFKIKAMLTFLTLTALSLAVALSAPAADQPDGPTLGTWQFTGKDNTGSAWSGTLKIEKLDLTRFEPKYHSLCILEVESTDQSKGTKGVEAPCSWNPATHAVTFGDTWPPVNVYTATLSADGKSLTGGKWTESKFDFKSGKVSGVVQSGEWSAKLAGQ